MTTATTHNPASFAHEQGAALVALTDLTAYNEKLDELLQFVMNNYDDEEAVRSMATWVRCYHYCGPEMTQSNQSAKIANRKVSEIFNTATRKYSLRIMASEKPIYEYSLP